MEEHLLFGALKLSNLYVVTTRKKNYLFREFLFIQVQTDGTGAPNYVTIKRKRFNGENC
jgi:hypothetical protein